MALRRYQLLVRPAMACVFPDTFVASERLFFPVVYPLVNQIVWFPKHWNPADCHPDQNNGSSLEYLRQDEVMGDITEASRCVDPKTPPSRS
jgi:hypothetical protein